MKKFSAYLLLVIVLLSVSLLNACGTEKEKETTPDTTATETTKKAPEKYENSEYLGSWYNADSSEKVLVCKLNADGSAVFKDDKKASWEETETGIKITTKDGDKKTTMEGYFVIAGDGYVARKTESNMHYLDEGGVLQLEIMLTENTCVDCVKKK